MTAFREDALHPRLVFCSYQTLGWQAQVVTPQSVNKETKRIVQYRNQVPLLIARECNELRPLDKIRNQA